MPDPARVGRRLTGIYNDSAREVSTSNHGLGSLNVKTQLDYDFYAEQHRPGPMSAYNSVLFTALWIPHLVPLSAPSYDYRQAFSTIYLNISG